MLVNKKEYKLEEVCIKITDGAHQSPKSVLEGLPMASVKDMTDYGLNLNSARKISLEDYEALVKQGCKPEKGDVLIAKDGSVLEVICSVDEDINVVLLSSIAILRPNPKIIDTCFLKYYLRSPNNLNYMKAHFVSGAVIQRVVLKDFKKVAIEIPDLVLQKKISNILDTLDKKILNLKQTNKTLESIAQAIFKSWFIDFDPVHAKQQGIECAGIDKATADLFPNSFDESELGLIPKGWEVGTVGKIFTLTMGQSPAGNTYNESGDGMEFYQGRTDFGFRFPSQRIFCNAPTRIAKENDILISVRAPVGDVNVALNECCIGRGVAAIRHPKDYQSYALYSMKQLSTKFKVFDGEGTVFGSINKTDFENIKLICPHEKIILTFEKIIEAFDKKIKNNEFSLRNIVALRDTLLPRLISGKLDLSNIEEQLGAVA